MKNPTFTKISRAMDDATAPVHCDPRACFENAIANGLFSTTQGDAMYVGAFMYMFSKPSGNGAHIDSFKNINTRRYVTTARAAA